MMREACKHLLKKIKFLRFLRWLRQACCELLDDLARGIVFFLQFHTASHTAEIKKATLHRILAVRLDRIGDLILTTPALRAIKETYPQSHLAVLVRRYTKDLIEGLPFIDEVIVLEDFKKDELIRYLKSSQFDVSLGFHPDFFVNYLPWKAGIPQRVGYKLCGSGLFLDYRLKDDRDTRIRHEVTSALEVAALIGAQTKDVSLSIAVHQEGEKFADAFFKVNNIDIHDKVIVIHPGARQPYVRWKKEGFAEVADKLIMEERVKVMLIGSEKEKSLVEEVRGLIKGNPFLAVGLTLAQLTSVLKRCHLFVGNSTGPMHMAAALKVPVVAIFGAIHPKDSYREWGPWGKDHVVVTKDLSCQPCHPGDCLKYECMDLISVQDVLKAASQLLSRAQTKT